VIRNLKGPIPAYATSYSTPILDSKDIISGITKPIGRAIENIEKAFENSAEKFILKMSPYFELGKKNPVKRARAAELTGLEEKELTRVAKNNPEELARLSDGKIIYMPKDYRQIYLEAHPQYLGIDDAIEIHHKIPQQVLSEHPHLFSHREIHGLDNLVGIPRDTKAHKLITEEWKDFFKTNPSPKKEDIVEFSNKIDERYGANYLP
jgi:hypothetical protein